MSTGVFEEVRVSTRNRQCAMCGPFGIRKTDPYLRTAIAPWAYGPELNTGRWDVIELCHVCGSQRHGRAVVPAA